MSFCEHCEGQRFDRSRVLRVLRAARRATRKGSRADDALAGAIRTVRALDIPHLEHVDETIDGEVIH